MGQAASHHDPRHVRIWNNLNAISAANARLQMLTTLFEDQEIVAAAKRAGVYADLLGWMSATRRGQHFSWPLPYVTHKPATAAAAAAPRPMVPILAPPVITKAPSHFEPQRSGAAPPRLNVYEAPHRTAAAPRPTAGSTELARIPPPRRALDVLHESYGLLGLDDSKPLTHEALRTAYKRAAIKAHPDKGGSAAAFDAVNRAFLYIEEVLNKLLPKTPTEGGDPRFTVTVTPEAALRARGDYVPGSTAAAPDGALRIEDAPQIALNPKKLDMALFNKLFEEHRLPDPDSEGYGDWLKSSDGRNDTVYSGTGKLSKDTFNRVFMESAQKASAAAPQDSLSKYKPPSDLVLSPGFGTMIGADRPAQFTKATGSMLDGPGLAYTDLKHAYGSGSTFSQEVSEGGLIDLPKEAALPGRGSFEDAKREYGSAPSAMTPEQAAAVAAFEKAREEKEFQRLQRLAAQDVNAEAMDARLKSRLLIRS